MKTWRQIPGYDGAYEVSDEGDVLSHKSKKLLRACIGSAGYPQVDLCRNGTRRTYAIHQLVAVAFLGWRPAGMVVCHNDGNKMHNAVSNLRIDSCLSNNQDKIIHGTVAAGERVNTAKLTTDAVIQIRKMAASGASRRSIAQQFGVSHQAIGFVVRGDTWKHIGVPQ